MDESPAAEQSTGVPRQAGGVRRVCVGVLAAAAVLLLLAADARLESALVYAALGAIVVGIALAEYGRLAAMSGMRPNGALLVVGGVAVFALHWASWVVGKPLPTPWPAATAALAAVTIGALCARVLRGAIEGALQEVSATVLGVAYIALPMACLTAVRMEWGTAGLLTLLVVTKCGSTGAYFAGVTLGRHKLAARISPNKTMEGAVGAFVACMLVSVAMSRSAWGIDMGLPAAVGLGAALAAAGIAGDLAESLLKRQAGAKDSGRLLADMGGVLDEVDDVLFAAPVGYLFLVVLGRLG